jgi:hypothetical protein
MNPSAIRLSGVVDAWDQLGENADRSPEKQQNTARHWSVKAAGAVLIVGLTTDFYVTHRWVPAGIGTAIIALAAVGSIGRRRSETA